MQFTQSSKVILQIRSTLRAVLWDLMKKGRQEAIVNFPIFSHVKLNVERSADAESVQSS